MRCSGESIHTQKASIFEAKEDQSSLLEHLLEFNNKSKSKKEGKDEKRYLRKSIYFL